MKLDGLQADALGISRCGSGGAVVHQGRVNAVWDGHTWVYDVGVPSKRPVAGSHDCVVYGPSGRVLVGVSGRFLLLDARTGEKVAKFTRGLRSRAVRRGVLGEAHGHRIVLHDGDYVLFDPATREVVFEMSPRVGFFGGVSTDVVGPSGRVLDVGGMEGMDAGWSESFDLTTGESRGHGGSGYAIDALELDADDRSLGIDDYMGLFGFDHGGAKGEQIHGYDLWLCGKVLYLTDAKGVLRLVEKGGQTRFQASYPRALCASDDGSVVGVIIDGRARILRSGDFQPEG